MSTSSSKSIGHNRSISLPSRSHPTTLQIEEQIHKLKTWEISATPSVESLSNGLCRLVELYKYMDDLLNVPQTLQALFKHRNAKWVDELLEGPLKLLDICSITRDVLSQFTQHARDLQSFLRRRKGDLFIEANILKYKSFRKKIMKDVKRIIPSLKQMDQRIDEASLAPDVDQHISSVIRVLREVNEISISIFQAVLFFLSASKSKPSKWSFSRLVHKATVSSEAQEAAMINELEIVDEALCGLGKNCSTDPFLQNKLEDLETSLEGIEIGLEGTYRGLIRSRTFLLNLVSC